MTSVLLISALWLAGYALACAVWPYAACGKCDGAGRFRSPSKKYWRPCRRCEGSGRRIRVGRLLVEWLRWGGRRGRDH
jgi:hypothetical protein